MAGVFLSAEWRQLAMLNYRVPRELLAGHVPRGTELDLWQGSPYVSVVGFMFLDTRIMGVPVPFHGSFEEVNLRTYVRRAFGGAVRHAVTFIRELVPRRAVATAARLSYNEPYRTVPMAHRISEDSVEYSWRTIVGSTRLAVGDLGPATTTVEGSEAEFITRRHWGYTRQRDGSTIEYEVRHPPWSVRTASRVVLEGDVAGTYGEVFASILRRKPDSAFLADGSPVTVHWPRSIGD